MAQQTESPSPIETVLAGSKPPGRPKGSGYVALILAPLTGALVAAASFRSMGQPRKGQQTVFYTLLLCIAFLIPFLLVIPADAPTKKIILLAAEDAGYSVFPSIIRQDLCRVENLKLWRETTQRLLFHRLGSPWRAYLFCDSRFRSRVSVIAPLLRLSVSFLLPIEQPLPDIWTCSTYPVTRGWHRWNSDTKIEEGRRSSLIPSRTRQRRNVRR
jgi:hypothetical protein